MPQTITPLADETPSDLAARTLGDASLFREVLGLNPQLDPFLPILQNAGTNGISEKEILAPLVNELASRAEPALTSIRSGVESALRVTKSALSQTRQYAAIADSFGLDLSSELNGVLGPAENALGVAQTAITEYGTSVKLVDWLLG